MSNFIKKQYYKNFTLGSGLANIITSALLFIPVIFNLNIDGDSILSMNRWSIWLLSLVGILAVLPFVQSVRDNKQYFEDGEAVDVWEVGYITIGGIFSLIISALILWFATPYALGVQAGLITLAGLITILIAFRFHLGKWFKFK